LIPVSNFPFIDKNIDHSDRMIFGNITVNAFWKQGGPGPDFALDESAYPITRQLESMFRTLCEFSHSPGHQQTLKFQ